MTGVRMPSSLRMTTVVTFVIVGLAACSGVRQQLGLEPTAPDEFAVVRKAPLTLPPDFNLRPPRPGAPRPQELDPRQQAQAALGGGGGRPAAAANASSGETALLRQAGAGRANSSIRDQLIEDEALAVRDRDFVDRLVSAVRGRESEVVNPAQEQRRVQQQVATGSQNAPDAPIIRRKSRTVLSGVF
ncbi:MAG: DUF3035 domain-containing protein [Alphaproteobacteria bacterium]|nr:DUF3035 domain-containing protein [Alphaproteobacteria bacterium]